eukprot:11114304-Alexandrium_andersonii.AAC.1
MEQLANPPAAMQVDEVEVIAVGSNSSDSIPPGQPSPGTPIPSLPEIARSTRSRGGLRRRQQFGS